MGEVATRSGLYGFLERDADNRRVPRDERKTYDVKAFWQRHHEIVNLAAEGFKQTEIAEILHIDPQTVSNTLGSTIGAEKLAELRQIRDGEAKKRVEQIRILTEKAIGVYHEAFDNNGGEVTFKDRLATADKVLMELSGLRVPTKIQTHSVTALLTKEDIDEFKRRGIEASKDAGLVVPDSEGG